MSDVEGAEIDGAGQSGRRLIWLASYPKSGNTWIRSFLAAYMRPTSVFELRNLAAINDSESRIVYFEDVAKKKYADMTPAEVNSLRRAVQSRIASRHGAFQLVKTHNANVRVDGTRLIYPEFSLRAVYVVRNPLDVVDSYADHAGRTLNEAIAEMANVRQMLGGPGTIATQYIGSWSQHVESWLTETAFPVQCIRYEDVLSDPIAEFSRLVKFILGEIDEARLSNAIQQTGFESLKDHEIRSGFAERSSASRSGRFFRHGQSGRWPSVLDREQAARIIEDHREVMALASYSIPDLDQVFSTRQE